MLERRNLLLSSPTRSESVRVFLFAEGELKKGQLCVKGEREGRRGKHMEINTQEEGKGNVWRHVK